ncbi:Specific transcriptional repressor [Mycena kentingensis (nom. inval.)]|nr:Specific transcriptional repressor [Mycena kentingensis (nom. inval.)]
MSAASSPLTALRSPSPEDPFFAQPDHFYSLEPVPLPPTPSSDKSCLSPDEDPFANRGIPVFRPSLDEFSDFEAYMTRVEPWGRRSGIVKVIPPKEWADALEDIKPQLAGVKIKSPIEQFMRGRAGLFRQENVEKRKVMSVREWAELCAKDEFRAPSVSQLGGHHNPQPSSRKRRKKDEDDSAKHESQNETLAIPSPPNTASPEPSEATDAKPRNRRVERADKDASFIETFNPKADWLPPDTNEFDYTPELCAKLERAFWRNCGLGRPAWYGADTMGSLFTNATTSWNVASLPSTLSRLLPSAHGLPGVNTPYLYFGMWRATFAWHVEDMDLFSINYIHFGAPKFWYAIPQGRAAALESTMRDYFPKDVSNCPQFLRHKSFLASPSVLAQSSVRPNRLVQHAGEFVITYPRGYHAGFNLGFNCAESVNFALESWLDEGRKAGVCKCVDFSVRIDVDQLLEDRRIEALEKTDPDAAARARSARDGPLPAFDPISSQMVDIHNAPIVLSAPPMLTSNPRSPRKRKPAASFQPDPPIKRARVAPIPPALQATQPGGVKLTLKFGPQPTDELYPCCICTDPTLEGLVRVHDLPLAWRDVCPTARIHYPTGNQGPGLWMVHAGCAIVLPETWIDEVDGERVVFGIDGIVRARWSLKCCLCADNRAKSHGALIQCTKGKCPKAFHINCARDGASVGVLYKVLREVEKEVVLVDPLPATSPFTLPALPDGRVLKVIKKVEVDALCPQHNPIVAAQRRAFKQDAHKAEILALPPLSRIRIRVSSGVFEVTLMRVHEDQRRVEVLWDVNEVREFKWSNIILPSTYADVPALSYPNAQLTDAHLTPPYAKSMADGPEHRQAPASFSNTEQQTACPTTDYAYQEQTWFPQ